MPSLRRGGSVNGKACGSMAWKNSYKNGIAKVLRQANTQKPAKRLRHKNTAPTHRSHHFYSVSFWLCRTCRKGWSLSIFCCILFFNQSIIFYEVCNQKFNRVEQHQPYFLHGLVQRFKQPTVFKNLLQAAAHGYHAAWQVLPPLPAGVSPTAAVWNFAVHTGQSNKFFSLLAVLCYYKGCSIFFFQLKRKNPLVLGGRKKFFDWLQALGRIFEV